MRTSQKGISLIKQFEGLRLKAYKAVESEKFYTIGYGHYSPAVKRNDVIDEKQAELFLIEDLRKSEVAVEKYCRTWTPNQNQFDALVSFTFNCGEGNLEKLVTNRLPETIGKKMLLYTKAGGVELKGLVRRRKAESELFFS